MSIVTLMQVHTLALLKKSLKKNEHNILYMNLNLGIISFFQMDL